MGSFCPFYLIKILDTRLMQPETSQLDQTDALYEHEWSAIKADKKLSKKVGRRKAQKITLTQEMLGINNE